MSVLKNNRLEARTEYEQKFKRLYTYMGERLGGVPKRRKRWLGTQIEQELNLVYEAAIDVTEVRRHRYDQPVDPALMRIQAGIQRLGKPLVVLCNVMEYPMPSVVYMYDLINKFGECAARQSTSASSAAYIPLQTYKPWILARTEFGANMVKLHRYTHSKVVKLSNRHAETSGALLINLMDSALYYVATANDIYPRNRRQYITRKQLIEKAIMALQGCNRPMMSLYALCNYSEKTQVEWAGMLNREIVLLKGLKDSDRKRFGNLE